MKWKGPVGPVGQTWACWARSVCGWRWLLLEGLRSVVGAHRVLSSTWLGGTCEDVCTWEIMKKSNTVSHKRLSLLLMGGRQDWCYGLC